ncbi:rCG27667 [Rattus norvegicus]|uniref:RCG27667 n=1 Tax=Rattus norvegicus TaxID=10116 RepID=A6KBU7_RAT|nr:rCG27667 [Rattus norvegicus]
MGHMDPSILGLRELLSCRRMHVRNF